MSAISLTVMSINYRQCVVKVLLNYVYERSNNMSNERTNQKYVNYEQGSKMFGMCKHSFAKLAAEAKAVSKIGKICIVDVAQFESFLEAYKVR